MSFLSVLVLFLAVISLTNIAGNSKQLIHAQPPPPPVPHIEPPVPVGPVPHLPPTEPVRTGAKMKILSFSQIRQDFLYWLA
ncbi:hypothetical protein A2U01_0001830 [Trifolium medium]|uniref:Uncharacterized protein n=1 Tax=Trifolium medium TaxID=97028 RepID=A0A392M148_9FABA|nr:hypothetical protein [Trifolium medium]